MSTTGRHHADVAPRRWDPRFFEGEPLPQHLDEHAEIKKRHTCAAIEARAKLKLARKYEHRQKGSLRPDQEQLVASLHDGTLEAEAQRLALLSGNERTPPNGEGVWQ